MRATLQLLRVLLFVILSSVTSASDWYVDAVNGDNANSGTSPGEAFRTVTWALAAASGGSATIHVAPGTYDEALGESFPWYSTGSAWIRGAGRDVTRVAVPGSRLALYCAGGPGSNSDLWVSGFTFSGDASAQLARFYSMGATVPAPGCSLSDSRTEGGIGLIEVHAGGWMANYLSAGLSGNELNDARIVISVGSGTSFISGGIGDNLLRRSSICFDSNDLGPFDRAEVPSVRHNSLVDSTIVVSNSFLTRGLFPGPFIRSNVFYDSPLAIEDEVRLVEEIGNNVFHETLVLYRSWGGDVTTEAELNALDYAASNRVTDPGFVDPSAEDYHLAPGSVCIDAGTMGSRSDFDGDPRPVDGDGNGVAEWDIGCDEAPADSGVLLRNDSIASLRPAEPPLADIFPLDPGGDLYDPEFVSGSHDPDELVLTDEERPLVFYALTERRSPRLAKTGDGHIRIAF